MASAQVKTKWEAAVLMGAIAIKGRDTAMYTGTARACMHAYRSFQRAPCNYTWWPRTCVPAHVMVHTGTIVVTYDRCSTNRCRRQALANPTGRVGTFERVT